MSARATLTDSPWFWLFLFGGMGLVAVIAVGPKHARRQERLDRMQQTRRNQLIAYENGVSLEDAASVDADDQPPDASANQRLPLASSLGVFLAGALALAWLARGILRQRGRQGGEPAP